MFSLWVECHSLSLLFKNHTDKQVTYYIGKVLWSTGLQRNKEFTTVKITLLYQSGYEITLRESKASSFTKENIDGQILVVAVAKVTKYQSMYRKPNHGHTSTHHYRICLNSSIISGPSKEGQHSYNHITFQNPKPKQAATLRK